MRDLQIFLGNHAHDAKLATVTIDMDNLRALFRARHFLAGVLIGAAILLAVLRSCEYRRRIDGTRSPRPE